ncbi:c-type cytochrome biogenesis protein CcmI [Aquamicrobium segne]|uniref:C-type cytochrome biogenesis protein CcmI n=1 Tax=Aquamicrobium segne TaxID=469547 RepID=A0ABW0GVU8_9HYPH
MLFWMIAAVLTLGASLAVLLPLAAQPVSGISDADHDLEVYRDQLDELERDLARGLIQQAEAEQARAEIGRRILRLSASRQEQDKKQRPFSLRLVSVTAVLAVPLISWGVYARLGSPDIPSQPLQERLARNLVDNTVDELIARAETHLAANPSDGRGWEVLAPIYMRMQRFDDAAQAYGKAIEFSGSDAQRQSALGEALASASGGQITGQARAAFEAALKHDPANPKAQFFLAMALAQEGRMAEAIAGWTQIRDAAVEGSPWRNAAERALAQAEQVAGQVVGQVNERGPGQAEVEAAAALSGEDRAEMISGMVERLDERLRENPADGEGWKQLVRSYLVLGDEHRARDALSRGVEALGADSEPARSLIAFAASNGLEMMEQVQ